ncbi:ATP-dependent DNA helicase DinG [Peribacillus sp. SCS-155]|uniref:ATP-dependent DNA helicase DinG n=1 Tax=Peribacillus sedimenti TaxID=3115297 RepID=UPI0039062895
MSQRYVVIDLETTGNSPKKGDRIIQFAGVVIEGDKIVDEYSTFIHPGQDIPLFIEELTGIDNEMVKHAPQFEDVAPRIAEFLADACFVAHNVLFDLSFLQEELKRCGFEGFYGSTIDTVELSKIMKPTSDGYKLNQLAKEENLQHERPHRADSDAYVTALLFMELKKKMLRLPLITLKRLYKLSFSLKSEISDLLDECIAERLRQPEYHRPEIEIFRGLALRRVTNNRTYSEGSYPYPYDHKDKMSLMTQAYADLESRPAQLDMMDKVFDSFINKEPIMIEAGTGIGKSLGYLLPAVFFAREYQAKVVISTYTLQLQEQLIHKEVPKVKSMVPFEFRAVLLKGRANYLSLAKFELALRQKEDNYETALAKMQILVWLTETETGDKDELNLGSGGQLFWERLQSDRLMFSDIQEPWISYDFYERAKGVADKADIIVTNHSFLMADILSNEGIIPKSGYLVLDEAHQLERAAARSMGAKMDYISVKTLFNRIGTYEQKLMLYRIEKICRERKLDDGLNIKSIERSISDFHYEFEQFFYLLAAKADALTASTAPQRIPLEALGNGMSTLSIMAERLVELIGIICQGLDDRLVLLKKADGLGKNAMFFLNEVEALIRHMEKISRTIHEFFISPDSGSVYWLEYTRAAPHHGISISSQPAAAGRIVWETFFAGQKSVVMTSATLSVKNSFRYFMSELGISDSHIKKVVYPEAFDFSKSAKVIVSKDMPDIQIAAPEAFSKAAAQHIVQAARGARGRTMILFTSHELLRMTYQNVKDDGGLEEFTLLAQGVTGGGRARLLKNFRTLDKAVLFGTAGLWEGIDIPGEDLSCLVIVRLPFSPPDEPVAEAKYKLIEQHGKNAFSYYSLPEAILRFRQGFGRLIRTHKDKGVLLLLDRRIYTAKYGKEFVAAIPAVQWEEVGLYHLADTIKRWLD